MKIILISGKAQHGKDTFANLLVKNFEKANKSYRIIHFGDAVKYVAKNFFGWNGKKDEVGRAILQKVGTDIVRKRDEHFWTDFVARLIPSFESEYILIPDWRFEEEYSHLLNYFSEEEVITVRINRYSTFQDFDKNIPYVKYMDKIRTFQSFKMSKNSLPVYLLLGNNWSLCSRNKP